MTRRRALGAIAALAVVGAGLAAPAAFPAAPPAAWAAAGDPRVVRAVAENHQLSLATSRELVDDSSVSVLPSGQVLFADPSDELTRGPRATQVAPDTVISTRAPAALAEETLSLHSDPASSLTVFLDVDGHTLTGDWWNGRGGLPATHVSPGFSLDLDHDSWSIEELTMVTRIWQEVSADLAIFGIDVTTEDPGLEALRRSSTADPDYGIRVLVTEDQVLHDAACGDLASGCSGIAFLSSFDSLQDGQGVTPALVFTDPRVSGEGLAGVASHEVGHTLGLMHDSRQVGDQFEEYYGGRGFWAPIMGGPAQAVTTWDDGSFPGATNQQDDLSVIASHGPTVRVDEAAGQLEGAPPLPEGVAWVTDAADVDTFALPACDDAVSVSVVSQDEGNLDATLELLDATGAVLVRDAQPIEAPGWFTSDGVTGRSAMARLEAGAGAVGVRVSSGPDLRPEGLPAYGSIGAYRVEFECGGTGIPAAVPSLSVVPGPMGGVQVSWGSPRGVVTGFTVSGGGEDLVVGPDVRHAYLAPPDSTDVEVRVATVGTGGAGPAQVRTVRTATPPRAEVAGTALDLDAGTLRMTWSDPVVDERWPLAGVYLLLGISTDEGLQLVREDVALSARTGVLNGVPRGGVVHPMLCLDMRRATVCYSTPVAMVDLPSAPQNVALSEWTPYFTEVSWGAPEQLGELELIGYETRVDGGRWVQHAVENHAQLTDLPAGVPVDVEVRAVTSLGSGETARLSDVPRGRPTEPQALTVTGSAEDPSVTWTPPELTGGSPVLHYLLRSESLPDRTVAASARSAILPELPRGASSTVRLAACNAIGCGFERSVAVWRAPAVVDPPPPPVVVDPPTPTPPPVRDVPSAPRALTVSPGSRGRPVTLTARWRRPATTGGAAITRYLVTVVRAGQRRPLLTKSVSARTTALTMRVPAAHVQVRVVAFNAIGSSQVTTSRTVRGR